MTQHSDRLAIRAAAIAAIAGAFLIPVQARAWVSFGIAIPPVVVAPAPYPYYPQPYYPPYPPGYYAPPPPAQSPAPQLSQNAPQGPVQYGATCYAGNYTCPAAPYSQVGTVCSCPGLGAPSFGTVQ